MTVWNGWLGEISLWCPFDSPAVNGRTLPRKGKSWSSRPSSLGQKGWLHHQTLNYFYFVTGIWPFYVAGGGVVFFGAVWHLSVTCVCQFHSFIHAVCNYTVLLRGRFSLGPLYSLDVVEEELVKHHLKWEKELDRRGVDSRDAGEGHGVGAVVQRWRGKCPDSAGGGVGRRVTGLNDITSCPSAFPVTCPPFYGATLQRCCGEPSNAHRHVWGILRRHGERRERRSEQTQPHGPRARGTLEIWLTLSLWKGFRKFPPISPSSLGVPGWLFILRLPGEFWGEEGAKVKTEQNVTTKQSCKC